MNNIKLPKIIGHRGAGGIAPENTLSSLISAHNSELSFVEIDVKISKDEIPVLLHDENLNRTTNGSGLCCDFNLEELLSLDAGFWFDNKYKNEKILSLSKALDYLYNNNMGVNIELKPNKRKERENVISIAKLFKIKKNIPKHFFSSFDVKSIDYVFNKIPLSSRGFLLDNKSLFSDTEVIDICKKYNCFSVGLEIDIINNERIDFFKKNNLIITAFTVNSQKIAEDIFSLGVSSIFTDRPDLLFF